jgi:hypothetical protein
LTSRFLIVLAALTCASTASAQRLPDRARLDWVTGFLMQGALAEASFSADFGQFGGQLIERDEGTLSIDPSAWYGVRGSYRFSENLTVFGSWMHSRGRFRVQFPAEASVEGDFDLEGLLMATLDFQSGTLDENATEAESAMSDALTDVYLASATYELPTLDRWFFPYVSLGAGLFKQKSNGDVIQFRYAGAVPTGVEVTEGVFESRSESQLGLSIFQVDQKNFMMSFGGGFRVSLAKQWGVDVMVEDLVRFGVDMSYLNGSVEFCAFDRNHEDCGPGTPDPDPSQFRFFSTTWNGNSNTTIHNFGFRIGLTYALWPYGAPR